MILNTWRQLSDYMSRPRRSLAAVAGTSLLGAISEAIVLVLVVAVAMFAAGQTESLPAIPLIDTELSPPLALAIAGFLGFVNVGAHILNSRATGTVAAEVLERTRDKALDGYFKAEWSLQARQRDGELAETVGVLSERISLLAVLLVIGISTGIQMLGLLGAALVVDAFATLIVVSAGAIVFAVLRPLHLAIKRRSEEGVRANTRFLTELGNVSGTALELRVFGVENAALESLQSASQKAATLRRSTQTAVRISQALYRNLAILFLVGAVGAVYALDPAELAPLATVVLLVLRAANGAQGVQTLRGQAAEYGPTIDLLKCRIAALESNRRRSGDEPLDSIEHVALRGVSYDYELDRPALIDIDLTIGPREAIGVVGPSGGGKSTLVQVLLRLRRPIQGYVLVNGVPYEDIDDHDWNRLVTVVPQEPHLIEGTVRDNIVFMRPDVTEDAIVNAARRAHILDEIERLPNGFDTKLGTRGLGLSGGQRQRLMIARALIERPSLLVLDEPTSALDAVAESGLRDTLAELAADMSIVLVTHRPVPLSICDRVITIEGCRLTNETRRSDLETDTVVSRSDRVHRKIGS